MKKTLIALALLSSASVSAVELSDFDFNPMIGLSWGGDSGLSTPNMNTIDSSLIVGTEIIYKDLYMFGVSGTNHQSDYDAWGNPKVDTNMISAYLGYFVSPEVVLKAGMTRQKMNITNRYLDMGSDPWNPNPTEVKVDSSRSRNYALVGVGYHVSKNMNINLHVNIPVSGDDVMNFDGETVSKSDYVNASLMLGYRF